MKEYFLQFLMTLSFTVQICIYIFGIKNRMSNPRETEWLKVMEYISFCVVCADDINLLGRRTNTIT
jgi:hypothetical protein